MVLVRGEWVRDLADPVHPVVDMKGATPSGITDGVPEPPVSGQYVLYIADSCPFSHRALMACKLLGLIDNGAVRVVRCWPGNGLDGFFFQAVSEEEKRYVGDNKGAEHELDPVHGFTHVWQVYAKSHPGEYTGPASVPILYDTRRGRIASNDSVQIGRILHDSFRPLHGSINKARVDLFPRGQGEKVDSEIKWVHENVCIRPYVGLLGGQQAYEAAYARFYASLDALERRLRRRGGRFLLGAKLAFPDLLLFATLVRYEHCYYSYFKLNKVHLSDGYPALWSYTKEIFQLPGISDVVSFFSYRIGYNISAPLRLKQKVLVQLGPDVDFTSPPGPRRGAGRKGGRTWWGMVGAALCGALGAAAVVAVDHWMHDHDPAGGAGPTPGGGSEDSGEGGEPPYPRKRDLEGGGAEEGAEPGPEAVDKLPSE